MNMINGKQLYTNQTSSRWKKVNKMRNFTITADLNDRQEKSSMVTYLVFCLFYSSICQFISVKNCAFVMGFIILAIYFRLKTTSFNVQT